MNRKTLDEKMIKLRETCEFDIIQLLNEFNSYVTKMELEIDELKKKLEN